MLASLVALVPTAHAIGRDVLTEDRIQVVLGAWTPTEYLARARVPGFSAYWNARNRVHQITEPDDRILFLFEARGLYFDRNVLQDNVLTNWPLLRATGATERCLEATGITHILLNQAAMGYYQRRGLDPTDVEWQHFSSFQARCLEPVFDEAGFSLFQVRADGSEPGP